MDFDLSFNETWALFRLTAPGSDLWFTERESLFYRALLLEVRSRSAYVCACLHMPRCDFDSLLVDVANRIFPRFHITRNALVGFTNAYSALLFRDARYRENVSSTFAVSFPHDRPEEHEDHVRSYWSTPALLDLTTVIHWSREEIDILSSVVFGSALAEDAPQDWETIRVKFVNAANHGDSSTNWSASQVTLNLYLTGMGQQEIAEAVGVSVGTVNARLKTATRAVARRIECGSKERAQSIHEFAKTWHRRVISGQTETATKSRRKPTPNHWPEFHLELRHRLGVESFAGIIAGMAPYRSLDDLVTMSRDRFDEGGPANAKMALRTIHKIANSILQRK